MPRQLPYNDARLTAARALGAGQGKVLSRKQLYDLAITRWEIRGQVRGHRWQLVGDQAVHLADTELSPEGERWAAVFQGGREASYVLLLVVQQRLASAAAVATELLRVRRDRRRLLLHSVVNELLDGAETLGEIDVATLIRRRGLPTPSRQVVRCDRRGRYYLDLYWPAYRLVVEIDGIHHAWAENVVGDALRQNSLSLDGDTVLRVPLLGLRLQPDAFLDQIEEGLGAAGWAAAV